jgi:hypothetical protein
MLKREDFGAEELESSDDADRIKRLAAELSARLEAASDFDEGIAEIIAELWALGHDLWNLDRTEDCEIWGPPTGGEGLLVTFWRARRVDVGRYVRPRARASSEIRGDSVAEGAEGSAA